MIGTMKGGVGAKSVSVFNLAYSLRKKGKNVLAIDLDPRSNLTTCFGTEEVDVSIGDLLCPRELQPHFPGAFLDLYALSQYSYVA